MRGDDAAALSAVVLGCGVAPSRLMTARTGRGRTLLVEAASKGLATCVAIIIDAWGADVDGFSSEDQGTARALNIYIHTFVKFDAFLMHLSPSSIRDRRLPCVIIVTFHELLSIMKSDEFCDLTREHSTP